MRQVTRFLIICWRCKISGSLLSKRRDMASASCWTGEIFLENLSRYHLINLLLLSSASSDRVPIDQPPFKTINSTEWCKSPCTVKLISTHFNSLAIMRPVSIVNLLSSSQLDVLETTLSKTLNFGVTFLLFLCTLLPHKQQGINKIMAESPCLIAITWGTTFIICRR